MSFRSIKSVGLSVLCALGLAVPMTAHAAYTTIGFFSVSPQGVWTNQNGAVAFSISSTENQWTCAGNLIYFHQYVSGGTSLVAMPQVTLDRMVAMVNLAYASSSRIRINVQTDSVTKNCYTTQILVLP